MVGVGSGYACAIDATSQTMLFPRMPEMYTQLYIVRACRIIFTHTRTLTTLLLTCMLQTAKFIEDWVEYDTLIAQTRDLAEKQRIRTLQTEQAKRSLREDAAQVKRA